MSVLVEICKPCETTSLRVSYASAAVQSGLYIGEEDRTDERLDLNQELIKNRKSTFYARVITADPDSGFKEGDLLVVDRSLPLQHNKMVVCQIDGGYTIRIIKLKQAALYLDALSGNTEPVQVSAELQKQLWGMVTYVVKRSW